jgi:hypothetical protein
MFLFCTVGMCFGALAAAGVIPEDDPMMGPTLLGFYGFFMVIIFVAASLHLMAGVSLLQGRPKRPVLWAATVASVLPLLTCYCAPTSMVAGVLTLVLLLVPAPISDAPAAD